MEDKDLKEAYASLVKKGDMSAVAALLVEYVDPQHVTADIMGLLLNTRNLAQGDVLVKKVRKGINVRTLVSNLEASL
jgi:hypothetical protein